MSHYQCYYEAKINQEWEQNPNRACWAGIKHYKEPFLIRIAEWEQPETKKYATLLTRIINKITPCWIEEGYIFYTIIENGVDGGGKNSYYNRNLILLNFIRYLWFNYVANPEIFFETLKKSRYKDPFKRLSKANLVNSQNWKSWSITPGHSNIDSRQKSIISLETFMNYTGSCTGFFNR